MSPDPLQGLRLAVLSCLCCLGHTHLQPPNLLPDAGPIQGFPRQRRWGERRISPDCFGGRHLLSFSLEGSASSLARIDQTDVGISSALPLALAFSVIPMLRLPTRLAVRSARSRLRARWAAFPCSAIVTKNDLGLLFTPAVRISASGHQGEPELDCLPFGPSLEQSLVAC